MSNPFNHALDWALRGKYVRVRDAGTGKSYEGFLVRIHHQKGSALLYDAEVVNGDKNVGAVFVRVSDTIEVRIPKRTVKEVHVDNLIPHPDHDGEFDVDEDIMRDAYRDKWTGSFPVVRDLPGSDEYPIINGHKRIAAAKRVGLEYHPVEIIACTDEQFDQLYELAHDEGHEDGEDDDSADERDGAAESDT